MLDVLSMQYSNVLFTIAVISKIKAGQADELPCLLSMKNIEEVFLNFLYA
ncbi:hypothetical protein ES703_41932 [subsurface metagenome]